LARPFAAKVEVDAATTDAVEDYSPTTEQVQSLLNVLVKETNIAELELESGDFLLRVKRSVAAPGPAQYQWGAPVPPPPVPFPRVEPMPAKPALASIEMTESIDETLLYVEAPKVGIFRRGRFAGGKRVGKGSCVNEGDTVKKGSAIGYIEQLGTHIEVKAPQPGEVVRFVVEDGAPVEYQQVIMELVPFFGGHIIGDQKNA